MRKSRVAQPPHHAAYGIRKLLREDSVFQRSMLVARNSLSFDKQLELLSVNGQEEREQLVSLCLESALSEIETSLVSEQTKSISRLVFSLLQRRPPRYSSPVHDGAEQALELDKPATPTPQATPVTLDSSKAISLVRKVSKELIPPKMLDIVEEVVDAIQPMESDSHTCKRPLSTPFQPEHTRIRTQSDSWASEASDLHLYIEDLPMGGVTSGTVTMKDQASADLLGITQEQLSPEDAQARVNDLSLHHTLRPTGCSSCRYIASFAFPTSSVFINTQNYTLLIALHLYLYEAHDVDDTFAVWYARKVAENFDFTSRDLAN